jgi:hypothetical protein
MAGKRVKARAPVQGTRRGTVGTQHNKRDVEIAESARYAARALQGVIADAEASGQARASAARTLAEMAGAIGRHQLAPVDRAQDARVSLLKRDELERELARLRTICAGDKPLSP